MVSRVLWGCRVLLALWVPLGKMETRERLGNLDRRGAKGTKATRVPLVPPVHKVPSGSQVHRELTVSQGHAASKAFSGRKVTKDLEASQDPLGLWGCRVYRDPQVRRARLETWVRWALQVLLAPEDLLDHQALTGPKVLLEA